MADQGFLAQLKPAANTNTVLYASPVDQSASTVLNVANDGTGSAFSVAVKDYTQRLTLDASTYFFHKGDVVSSYYITTDATMSSSSGFSAGQLITTEDKETSFRFESFYTPPFTEIFVKTESLRAITVESLNGTFAAGETIATGAAPDDTTALIYGVAVTPGSTIVYVGPSTINGSSVEFAAGNSVYTSNGSATIAAGGIAAANPEFIFSTTTSGGVYNVYIGQAITVLVDRTYRFNVADATMAGRDFKLSSTTNGEWGPDNTIGGASSDDGTEFTEGKTSSGTAGTGGAYVQFDFTVGGNLIPSILYFYDGGTGTAANAFYGGSDRFLTMNYASSYNAFYIYDLQGTITTNTDTFIVSGVTYTITAESTGPYGYVRRYSGTDLDVILGPNSSVYAGSEEFRDVPKLNTAGRSTATVSSIDVDETAVEDQHYYIIGKTNSANNVDKTTSFVVGPGETVVVYSVTQNNVFSLVGFEDGSSSYTVRIFGDETGNV